MKISELPKEIREKALKYQKEDGYNLETDKLHEAFTWHDTEEGMYYWNKWDEKKQMKDTIVEAVVNKFKQRSNVGIKKYGVTLDREDLTTSQWIEHAIEEAMDLTLYLEKLKRKIYLIENGNK